MSVLTVPAPVVSRAKKVAELGSREQAGASALLKGLVWFYLALLVLEGALRKWVLPQYSSLLLVVRDPVVFVIYFLAMREGVFRSSSFLGGVMVLGSASLLLSALQYILLKVPLSVLFFGWRTDFLHLPLMFLLPQVFDLRDVRRVGRWVLLGAIPMALLMGYQFRSTPDAWINRTPGLSGGTQLLAVAGKIRPPGTFSFITGPVSYFALTAAFLAFGVKQGRMIYPRLLLVAASLALALALAVSGSRSIVISVAIVVLGWLLAIVAARQLEAGMAKMILLLVITCAVLAQMELFKEGTEVMSTRWEAASASESAEGGMIGRVVRSLVSPLMMLPETPLFGHGLGVGTNVGATLLTGQAQFLLSEGEWGRVLMEMGWVVGLAFILFRVSLTIWLARLSIRCAMAGNILPMLLFSACAVNVINGQIAQPTTLGFTAFGTGLCLAAICATPWEAAPESRPKGRGPVRGNLPRAGSRLSGGPPRRELARSAAGVRGRK